MTSHLRFILLVIFLIQLLSCTGKVVIHDQDTAAERAAVLLEKIIYEANGKYVYKLASSDFKNVVKISDFELYVDNLAYIYPHNRLIIEGYEYYGGEELLTIYASSDLKIEHVYFAITFQGSSSKGYKLSGFKHNNEKFRKNGIYNNFNKPIVVAPSGKLSRLVELNNGTSVFIHGVDKLFLKGDKKWVYVLKYLTDIKISKPEAITEQAKEIFDIYGQKKAESIGVMIVMLEAANKNYLENSGVDINTYRSVFTFVDNKWSYFVKQQ